jgi:hypothetical protein
MLLVTNGVPYSEAMNWSQARRIAALVAIGESKGQTFDWDRMAWEPLK